MITRDEVVEGVGSLRVAHRMGATGVVQFFNFETDQLTVALDEPRGNITADRASFCVIPVPEVPR